MSEHALATVAVVVLVLVGSSAVGLVVARVTRRPSLRRASAIVMGVGLVTLLVAAQFDRRAEDCARAGGTMVDDTPLVLEAKGGRASMTRAHCVLPASTAASA